MIKQRIYIDTSVIGGYYDVEFNRYSFTFRVFKNMITTVKKEKKFDTVAFFRAVKEKMAKATEGMTLEEERKYWKLMREGKIKLT